MSKRNPVWSFSLLQTKKIIMCGCLLILSSVCPAGTGLLQLVWAVWAGSGQQWELAQSSAPAGIWTRTTQSATGPMSGEQVLTLVTICHLNPKFTLVNSTCGYFTAVCHRRVFHLMFLNGFCFVLEISEVSVSFHFDIFIHSALFDFLYFMHLFCIALCCEYFFVLFMDNIFALIN